VLGKKLQNGAEYFLVAFFQAEHSSCFVPSEYLFQLHPQTAEPLSDDSDFKILMEESDLCVDCLLERIFRTGQVLAINQADVLFPQELLDESLVKPNPQQIQQTMFQCVTCAALLIATYIASRWHFPPEKLRLMISMLFKTSQSKYISTQPIMSNANALLTALLFPNSN
jgi:hypothetical protein